MSLAQKAVEQHRQALANESKGIQNDRDRHLARYAELMLSDDDSPEAQQELAGVLFVLEEELTPDDVLADERAIQKARQLMKLHSDREAAHRERHDATAQHRATQRLMKEAVRYAAIDRINAEEYSNRCTTAAAELVKLAARHPHLFDDAQTPVLLGADTEQLADDLRGHCRREALYRRLMHCEGILAEVVDILATLPADHEHRTFYELWQAERVREQVELLAELQTIGSNPEAYSEFKAANPQTYRQLTSHVLTTASPTAPPADVGETDIGASASDASDDEGDRLFVSNQGQAAAAIAVSSEEWDVLRTQEGFPKRSATGWDIAAIRHWLNGGETNDESAAAGTGETPLS